MLSIGVRAPKKAQNLSRDTEKVTEWKGGSEMTRAASSRPCFPGQLESLAC